MITTVTLVCSYQTINALANHGLINFYIFCSNLDQQGALSIAGSQYLCGRYEGQSAKSRAQEI